MWRAAIADDDLRRAAFALDFDDDVWEPIEVPGHWRSTAAFSDTDGPLIYRTHFELEPGPPDARSWVVLDGLFYQGDVWLDGAYLGDPEGYFFPHAYDITDLARLSPEHVLAVEVTCSPPSDRTAKRNITGVFQHWDCIDPTWNPGGLWRPVRIERSGPVRIETCRVICREAEEQRAVIAVSVTLDSAGPRTVRLRTRVDDRVERDFERSLGKGANRVEWTFGIDNPDLWWPYALGEQPLSTVTISVLVDDEVSDERTVRTGLRQVSLRNWTLAVNGERLFVKGANLGPTRAALAEAAPSELARDVELAREAGLDLLRIHGHVTRPELYEAADRLGMLVWQDFPLQWGYAPQRAPACGASSGRHGRPTRAPPLDRAVVRTQRTLRARHRSRRTTVGRRARPLPGRSGVADVEQDVPRPFGEALDRAGRRESSGHRALRCAPASTEARRHRFAPLLRLVSRRRT